MRVLHKWDEFSAKIQIEGLNQSLRVLHLTDSHLVLLDDRDKEHIENSRSFQRVFLTARKNKDGEQIPSDESFSEIMKKAEEMNLDMLLMSGDILSFPAKASLEFLQHWIDRLNVNTFYTAGNHDWHFPGQDWGETLRRESRHLLEPVHGGDDHFHAETKNGVHFLSIDNSVYQVDEEQLEFTKQELKKGLPTILQIHIPISLPSLREPTIKLWKNSILMGDPEWTPEAREKWQVEANHDTTLEFIDFISSSPNLVAVLCGHVHFAHADNINTRAMQYVGAPGFEGGYRLIEIEPLKMRNK